ncbi:MAG: DUF4328 domain-containing protein [Actinomycetota bacterium]|nr:DUF4328 domain-containing protein [Actinomycetota bacterium]
MADRPREDDWWLASDGKWYPPNLGPGVEAARIQERQDSGTAIRPTLTTALSIALAVASAVLLVAAYSALQYASALQKFTGSLSDQEIESLASVELVWASWSAVALFLLVFTGVLVIVWTNTTSRSFDNRGPIGRRWRGGWTIGAWLIPLANLVIPKLMFNEIEKIAQVPYRGVPIGEEWRMRQRSQLGDLWWLLWIGGAIPSQLIQAVIGDPVGDAGRLAVVLNINSLTHALFAGAGISLAFLVRRIERFSRA